MEFAKLAQIIASLIGLDWTPVEKEHAHQDNVGEVTNISQDLVN
jgi:hypothetical protein